MPASMLTDWGLFGLFLGAKMGYQFLHIEGYARVGSRQERVHHKTKKPYVVQRLSVDEVAAEAEREPSASLHVLSPKPPIRLHGCSPSEAVERAKKWAEGVRDSKGRKMRKDGICLASGVISMPDDQRADWPRFREAAVCWLKKQYGARLLSVVEHRDEKHPHFHFYAVPLEGESFDRLHPGRAAAANAAKGGQEKKAQRVEYMTAMRVWQDDFSRECASNFGLARLGPGRRRLTRGEWHAEQAQAKALAAVELPIAVGLSAKDVAKVVLEARTLRLDLVESDADQAKRLNALFAKRVAPLLAAAKQAKPAREQADRLVRETTLLKAKNDALQARLSMFTPAEIEAAQERQQQLDEAEQMRQADAFLAAQELQAKNDKLLRLAAQNMLDAGEVIDLDEALLRVECLADCGVQGELLQWIEWTPSVKAEELLPKQQSREALHRNRDEDDGPSLG